jgi:hypothetical protein
VPDAGAEEEGVTIREDGLALLDRDAARRAFYDDGEPSPPRTASAGSAR